MLQPILDAISWWDTLAFLDQIAWVWTVLAVLGGVAALYNLGQSTSDWREARLLGNGRRIIARGRLVRDIARLALQVIYTSIGFAVATHSFQREVTRLSLTVAVFLVLVMTVHDSLERRELLRRGQQQGRRITD